MWGFQTEYLVMAIICYLAMLFSSFFVGYNLGGIRREGLNYNNGSAILACTVLLFVAWYGQSFFMDKPRFGDERPVCSKAELVDVVRTTDKNIKYEDRETECLKWGVEILVRDKDGDAVWKKKVQND